MINIEPIKAFSDNYIWLLINEKNAFAVDPGEAKPLNEVLESKKLSLKGVLITHHHFDHSGGITELQETHNIKVYGPRGNHIKGITHPVGNGDEIDIFGHQFLALSTPGHTDDQIAYFNNSLTKPVLFSGDTLFAAGCGRLFEGTALEMFNSLNIFAGLPSETLVYCGHEYTLSNLLFASTVEPLNKDILKRIEEVKALRANNIASLPSSIKLEMKTNPFMRCDKKLVIKAAEKHSLQKLNSPSEVLASIRNWKDNY
jgi:hydroxyacylglutathione hydrolase